MLPSSPLDEQAASQQSSVKKEEEYEDSGVSDDVLKRVKKMKTLKAVRERYSELDDYEYLVKQQVDNNELTLSEYQTIYNDIRGEKLALETREQQLRSQYDIQTAKTASTNKGPGSSQRSKSAGHRGPGSTR